MDVSDDCSVEGVGETLTVDVADDGYLLAATRVAEVWLPADCQQGWCTTSAAELLDGGVDQPDARAVRRGGRGGGYSSRLHG